MEVRSGISSTEIELFLGVPLIFVLRRVGDSTPMVWIGI